jgi:hypothetical protein
MARLYVIIPVSKLSSATCARAVGRDAPQSQSRPRRCLPGRQGTVAAAPPAGRSLRRVAVCQERGGTQGSSTTLRTYGKAHMLVDRRPMVFEEPRVAVVHALSDRTALQFWVRQARTARHGNARTFGRGASPAHRSVCRRSPADTSKPPPRCCCPARSAVGPPAPRRRCVRCRPRPSPRGPRRHCVLSRHRGRQWAGRARRAVRARRRSHPARSCARHAWSQGA